MSPSITVSLPPPMACTTTGVPSAIASTGMMPKSSIAGNTKTDAAWTGAETDASAYNPLADGTYYGMMGLGFIVALIVYFAAKRML